MKTISVKEAAGFLGVSPRAVQYRLQNGELKGTRTKNQYGVLEWRVYPNKDIQQAASSQPVISTNTEKLTFEPESSYSDTLDAEELLDDSTPAEAQSWRNMEMERLELMAEKLIKPLTQRLEAQAIELREQEKLIDDQKRQLRLLPDLQKQADEERKTAQAKAFELTALEKQLAALAQETQIKDNKLAEAQKLEEQVATLSKQIDKLQLPWWKKILK